MLVFYNISGDKYPDNCTNDCVVEYLQFNSGNPPVQVRWPKVKDNKKQHIYWVHWCDLRILPQGSQYNIKGKVIRIGFPTNQLTIKELTTNQLAAAE
jgi:hypothetical protein